MIPSELVGLLANIDDSDEWRCLVESGYPSLWEGQRVLFGPLSLLNHSCEAALQWKNPSYRGMAHTLLQGFATVRVKLKPGYALQAGKELLVRYGDQLWFHCECSRCTR